MFDQTDTYNHESKAVRQPRRLSSLPWFVWVIVIFNLVLASFNVFNARNNNTLANQLSTLSKKSLAISRRNLSNVKHINAYCALKQKAPH